MTRILIVDDYWDAAESLAFMLHLDGFTTEVATEGMEAWRKAERFRPHTLITETRVGRMSGCEIANRLRQTDWARSLHLIALTGSSDDGHRRNAMALGFECYFVNPVDPAVLKRSPSTIRDALALRRA